MFGAKPPRSYRRMNEIGLENLRQSAKFLRDKFVKHFGGGGDE